MCSPNWMNIQDPATTRAVQARSKLCCQMGYQRIKGSRTFYSLDVRLRIVGLEFKAFLPVPQQNICWGSEGGREAKSGQPVTSPTQKASLLTRGSPAPGCPSREARGRHKEGANVKASLVLRPAPRPTAPSEPSCAVYEFLVHDIPFPALNAKIQEFSRFSLASNHHQEQRT